MWLNKLLLIYIFSKDVQADLALYRWQRPICFGSSKNRCCEVFIRTKVAENVAVPVALLLSIEQHNLRSIYKQSSLIARAFYVNEQEYSKNLAVDFKE